MTRHSRRSTDADQIARIVRGLKREIDDLKKSDVANENTTPITRRIQHAVELGHWRVRVRQYDTRDAYDADPEFGDRDLADKYNLVYQELTPVDEWTVTDQTVGTDSWIEWVGERLQPDSSRDSATHIVIGSDPFAFDHSSTSVNSVIGDVPVVTSYTSPRADGSCHAVVPTLLDEETFNGEEIGEFGVRTSDQQYLSLGQFLPDGTTIEKGEGDLFEIEFRLAYRPTTQTTQTTLLPLHRYLGYQTTLSEGRVMRPISDANFGISVYVEDDLDATVSELQEPIADAPVADWGYDDGTAWFFVFVDATRFQDRELTEIGLKTRDGDLLTYSYIQPAVQKSSLETMSVTVDIDAVHPE